jgi:hypothetical protein
MSSTSLAERYQKILSSITSTDFIKGQDLYSGVFLSKPFEQYHVSPVKLMLVGRETAGWNTKSGKNTIGRIVKANQSGNLDTIIDESFERFSWHLLDKKDGSIEKTTTSSFKRFHLNLAITLKIDPHAVLYQNLYAWDCNERSPVERDKSEFAIIQEYSAQLLAASIQHNQPDIILFAVGCNATNDQTIKRVCEILADGSNETYKTEDLEKRRYWHFLVKGMDCFRISHPRRQDEIFVQYREKAIEKIMEKSASRCAA